MEEPRFTRRTAIAGALFIGILAFSSVFLPPILSLIFPAFHGVNYDNPQQIDFSLPMAPNGDTFNLGDYRGKVVVIYFGYTNCPDICPTTLYDLHRTMGELGKDASEVQVVFITIDPERDNSQHLADYLSYFDKSFVGLYGTMEQLQPVYDQFGVRVLSKEQTTGALGHTADTFLIDRSGKLRVHQHYGMRPEQIAEDLQILIREKGS